MEDVVFTKLSLTFVTGFKDNGEPILKAKHYQNIKPEADSANLFTTALAIASLQKHELDLVERSNTYELGE